MARPVHPGFSPVMKHVFGSADRVFGIPKRIFCDNSGEFRTNALEAFVREQIDLVYGVLPQRPGKDTDA